MAIFAFRDRSSVSAWVNTLRYKKVITSAADQATGVARHEVQCVHDPGQLTVPVPGRAHLPIARQVGAMLRLAVDLVGDDERVVAETGGALIHPFQEMLKYHRGGGYRRR
jgi:hypothetical protein